MKRIVIDTNCLEHLDLETYLSEASDNFGLITQISLIEVHKKAAIETARKAMRVLCRYPSQIVFLKDMTDLVYMNGTTSPLLTIVDTEQTPTFDAYCETMINCPVDEGIIARFDLHQAESRQFVDDMVPRAANIYNIFRMAEEQFTPEDVEQLRKRECYSGDLQRKIMEFAFAVRELMIMTSDVDPAEFPQTRKEIIDTYMFRYALVIALYFTRWITSRTPDKTNINKIINHLLDMKIAAMATFFEGLMTRDAQMKDLHAEAVKAVTALGGCVNCGQD